MRHRPLSFFGSPAAAIVLAALVMGAPNAKAQPQPSPLPPGTQAAPTPPPTAPTPDVPYPGPMQPAPQPYPPPQVPPVGYAPLQPGTYPGPQTAPPPPLAPRLPSWMDFIPGAPIPPGYHIDTRPRYGLAVGGMVTAGALYVTSIITAGLIYDNNHQTGPLALFVPVAGPFIGLGTMSPGAAGGVLLVLDGIGQSAGLAMSIAGFAAPRTIIVRSEYGSVHFEPLILRGGAPQMGLSGDF